MNGVETLYFSTTHPDPTLRPRGTRSTRLRSPRVEGKWHVVLNCNDWRLDANPNPMSTDPFVVLKLWKALKMIPQPDYVVFVCESEEVARDLFRQCHEEWAPYSVLIDPRGECVSENT